MKTAAFATTTLAMTALYAGESQASAFLSKTHVRNTTQLPQKIDRDEDHKDDPLRGVKHNYKIFQNEFERRGAVSRSGSGAVVGAVGGAVRKAVSDNTVGDFAGAMGGVGFFKGAAGALFTTAGGVIGETIAGHALGRTASKEEKLTDNEIKTLRNIEQVIGGALGGALSGVLGNAVKDGVITGVFGGVTLMLGKKAVAVIEKLYGLICKDKNAKLNPKLRNILLLSISGAIGGIIVSAKGNKGTLTIPKEALIGAVRGAVRGVITEEENKREARVKQKNIKAD